MSDEILVYDRETCIGVMEIDTSNLDQSELCHIICIDLCEEVRTILYMADLGYGILLPEELVNKIKDKLEEQSNEKSQGHE